MFFFYFSNVKLYQKYSDFVANTPLVATSKGVFATTIKFTTVNYVVFFHKKV